MNLEAYFDALAITCRVAERLGDATESEVHTFAYLACLLSLYKGRAVADWGYRWASTAEGVPFSREVSEALGTLGRLGHVAPATDPFFRMTSLGHAELAFLGSLRQDVDRMEFIDAACATMLVLPVGSVRSALLVEPELTSATRLGSSRFLLDGPGVQLLHDHFQVLSEATGLGVSGLAIPASVWISYLDHARDLASGDGEHA